MSVHFKRHLCDGFIEIKSCENNLYSIPPHSHQESSLGFIEKGRCCFDIGGYSKVIDATALVYFAPKIIHSSKADSTKDWKFRSIYWNDIHKKYSHCHAAQSTLDPLSAMMAEQFFTQCENKQFDQVMLDSILYSFVSSHKIKVAIKSPIWNEMEALLKIDYEGFWSLDKLAIKMGYDKRYLTRVFKQLYGTTPAFYRQICRVIHAKDLLRQGYAISDVAQICGFHDQSHLNKVFVSFSGTTPKCYRDA